MKILHYHREMNLETGGVVRCVLDLCTGLAAAGHDVTVLTTDGRDLPDAWRDARPGAPRGVVIDPPTRPGGLFARPARRALSRWLDDADVLHLHSMWTTANIQIAADARRLGVPYIYSVHGMLDDWCMAQRGLKKRFYISAWGRRMLQGAAAVHTTAAAELEQARKWFPRGRGVVIPLVIDLEPFATLPGPGPARNRFPELADGRSCLLFLSRIHFKKRPELLIDAAALLHRDGHDVRALIAGTGDERYVDSLRDLVRRRGLEDVVQFPGFVSGVEKVSLYEAADVFVLPTSQENFGFVLFEALAATTPVVTTRGADTWPELEASGGGVIVEPDPAAIADAVTALIDDPARQEAMGQAGRQWVFAHLSAERVVHRFEELYAEAVAAAHRPHRRL